MDLKSKLAAAMNRAKQSPMDGGDKKKKKKSSTSLIYMEPRKPSKIPYTGPKTLAQPQQSNQTTSQPKDYKQERRELKQQYKTERYKARQESKLDKIKSKESGSGLKKVEGALGAAGTVLGLAETAKRIFAKNKNQE